MSRLFILLLMLAACAPVPLGSVITSPLEVSPSHPLQVSAGQRWYVAVEYDRQQWRGRALRLATGQITDRNLERIGSPIYPAFGVSIRGDFGLLDPFSHCSFRGNREGRSANHFTFNTTEIPPGWQAGLVDAQLLFECGNTDDGAFLSATVGNQPQRTITIDFTTLNRLTYAFDVPTGTAPGQYRLVLEVRDVQTNAVVKEQLLVNVVPAS